MDHLTVRFFVCLRRRADGRVGSTRLAVEKGEWFDLFFQIKWSLHDDGYVEMYVDGKPVTPFNGEDFKFYASNVYNEVGNYLKIGLYRDERAEAINSVYVDDLAIVGCR